MPSWAEHLDVLVRDRGPALLRYGYLLTGSTAEAEELVQEALVRVLARRPRLRAQVTLESYVRRTMLTTTVDAGRRTQLWRRVSHLLVAPEVAADQHGGAEDRGALVAALATLSPQQRACVVLRYVDDLSGPEIAETLGISTGSVKRYLSDGVARLGRVLGPVEEPDDVVGVRGGAR